RRALLVIAEKGLAVAVEVLNVQIAVHIEERPAQGPSCFKLHGLAPAFTLAVETCQNQAIVLSPARLPVHIAGIICVVGVVRLTEVAFDPWREGEGTAAREAIVELRLQVIAVDGTR